MLFALPKADSRRSVGRRKGLFHHIKTNFPCDSEPQSYFTFDYTETVLIYCFAGGVGFTLGLVDFWDKSELFIYIMVRTINW
jgi:hypothetical protein